MKDYALFGLFIHLDAYIQECCFKYNNRNNANMFGMLLINCVR